MYHPCRIHKWNFYNGQDLKGYLLDFSLADIGFGRVCNQPFLCEKISHQFEISTYFKGSHHNIHDIIYNDLFESI